MVVRETGTALKNKPEENDLKIDLKIVLTLPMAERSTLTQSTLHTHTWKHPLSGQAPNAPSYNKNTHPSNFLVKATIILFLFSLCEHQWIVLFRISSNQQLWPVTNYEANVSNDAHFNFYISGVPENNDQTKTSFSLKGQNLFHLVCFE